VKDLAAYPSVDVRFFYGRGANRQPLPDEVFLDVADDYRSLPYKTKGMCAWAGGRYDFIFKVDDDTFVWVNNLLSSEFERCDYVGCVNASKPHAQYATGLGYWLSAKAAGLVANARPNNDLEDHWVGSVLRNAGIMPKHDERYVSVDNKFVGVSAMPRNPKFIALHPCSPEMLRACASECV
jgi:hypothetical protein